MLDVYRLRESFPQTKLRIAYNLEGQRCLFRELAEGFRKKSPPTSPIHEYFPGSLEECRYYLILAQDWRRRLRPLMSQLEEVSKLLNGYSRAIVSIVAETCSFDFDSDS